MVRKSKKEKLSDNTFVQEPFLKKPKKTANQIDGQEDKKGPRLVLIAGEEVAKGLRNVENDPKQVLDVVNNVYGRGNDESFANQEQLLAHLDRALNHLEYNQFSHSMNHDNREGYDTASALNDTDHAIRQVQFTKNYFQNKDNFNAYQQEMHSKGADTKSTIEPSQNSDTPGATPLSTKMQPLPNGKPSNAAARYQDEMTQIQFDNKTDPAASTEEEAEVSKHRSLP
jgi:hypothetical protein